MKPNYNKISIAKNKLINTFKPNPQTIPRIKTNNIYKIMLKINYYGEQSHPKRSLESLAFTSL